MKRYLITTKDVSEFTEPEQTSLATDKHKALLLLSSITNNGDEQLVSVIEIDIDTAQATKLEPYLNSNFKLDLREKQ
ncbi:hypothetical protein FH508_0008500 [Lysinibacillus sp. CD3-6]|uniref:hypothetical protein n=1 Tax=Lysinibacillus sp. CD3-6 TaxID=2892541 RepID=UPI0011205BAA|nr:hypothetical protein [Lysinibacillus sp. CD3-6]UED81921.1 hypothetical protein FH508_0008500 [Lysinibacillus sp. CD3-6]